MEDFDAVQIKCKQCGKIIGMIENGAEIVFPKCANCANLLPGGDDILYSISNAANTQ